MNITSGMHTAQLPEVGIANFFFGPLIAKPLINPLNANPIIFNNFRPLIANPLISWKSANQLTNSLTI
jgi:hypothetical protein